MIGVAQVLDLVLGAVPPHDLAGFAPNLFLLAALGPMDTPFLKVNHQSVIPGRLRMPFTPAVLDSQNLDSLIFELNSCAHTPPRSSQKPEFPVESIGRRIFYTSKNVRSETSAILGLVRSRGGRRQIKGVLQPRARGTSYSELPSQTIFQGEFHATSCSPRSRRESDLTFLFTPVSD